MKNRIRKAGVTIEVALSIALSVVILFLVLGLFSENLKEMVSKTGLKKTGFSNDVKTAYSSSAGTQLTEVNVQVTADQGLSAIHKQAKAEIDDYYNNKSTNGKLNNPSDSTGLAKALTKFALSGKSTSNYLNNLDMTIPGTTNSYSKFANSNDIYFSPNPYATTYPANKDGVAWEKDNPLFIQKNATDRLKSITTIESQF